MFRRHFLTRRFYDTLALGLAFAMLGVFDNGAKFVFALFVFAGTYLVLGRHRSVARAPWALCGAFLAYGVWTIALSLLRGEPVIGNRQVGYGLIAVCFAFFPMGIVLVADPLRAAVSGARVGVVAAALLSLVEYLVWGGRVGLGENFAIFAFIVAALGVLTRIDLADPYRFLPNSRMWFYLSFLPVVLSQTRAAWAIYGLAVALDAAFLLWRRGKRTGGWLPLLAAIGLAVVVAVPGVRILSGGLERGLAEYHAYDDDVRAETSIGIRMAMWRGSVEVLRDNPLTGVGGMSRMDEVADRMPSSADVIREFTHLHNLVLDEMLSNGLVGLALMFAVFGTFLVSVFRLTDRWNVREASILLVLLVFNFGFFHGVMLHETTLMTMYASFAVIVVGLKHRLRRLAYQPAIPVGHGAREAAGAA